MTARIAESETQAAGERSADPPSGLRGNRNHAAATTRTLQDGSAPQPVEPYDERESNP